MGFGPQLVDLNGDGQLDILSGSWPGELFLFRGAGDGKFAAPEMLRDRDGQIINIGGGIEEQRDGSIFITGHATFETTDEGTFVDYHGQRLESTPEKPISITGTASAVHAVDWDSDGDLDLLVGDIGGNVYLIPNEGTREAYAFGKEQRLESAGEPLRVAGDAGPFAADWDGDGRLDLLVGAGDGSVSLFRNTAFLGSPHLAAAETLVPPGSTAYGDDAPTEPKRGTRSKVCAADWNGDGRLDLLVGDFGTQKPDRPEPTADEKARHDELRAELDTVRKEFSALIPKIHGPSRVRDKEALEKVRDELRAVQERMAKLQAEIPAEYENHGWVWLFLREAGEAIQTEVGP